MGRAASRSAQRLRWAVQVNPVMRRVTMAALRRVAMTCGWLCGSLTSRLTARHQAGAYNSQHVWSADR